MNKGNLDRSGAPRRPARLARKSRARAISGVRAAFGRLMVAHAGAVAAEYTFLVAFIAILAAIGMVLLGDDLQQYFQGLADSIENASTPTADPFAT